MKSDFKKLLRSLTSNVSLAPLTTLGVGGEARFFVAPESVDDVVEALEFARERNLPVFVLGGGSNIVVADDGWDGLVLAVRIPGIAYETQGDCMIAVSYTHLTLPTILRV